MYIGNGYLMIYSVVVVMRWASVSFGNIEGSHKQM